MATCCQGDGIAGRGRGIAGAAREIAGGTRVDGEVEDMPAGEVMGEEEMEELPPRKGFVGVVWMRERGGAIGVVVVAAVAVEDGDVAGDDDDGGC